MNKLPSFNSPRHNKWIIALSMVMLSFGAFAQSNSADNTILFYIVAAVGIMAAMVLVVAIYALRVISLIVTKEEAKRISESGVELKAVPTMWQKFLKLVNNRVDRDEEESIILDHDYDGIKELNNHLPPWWNYLFYATIIFGVIYVMAYHFTGTFPLQEEEYEIEMAEAAALAQIRLAASEADGTAFSEADLALSDDTDILASGKKVFDQQCAVCHKLDGGGSIGPNLTDNYWLHGGDIKSVFSVIKVGVPDKGMISWEAMLSPTQMRDVSNYIISLKGSNPPNAKAPQGELEE